MRILKISLGVIFALILAIAGFFTYQFWPRTVETFADLDATIPAMSGPSPIRLSAFSTGFNESPEAVIYSGGNLFKAHQSVYSGFVIEHPDATILLEGGIGENIAAEHAENFNLFEQQLFAYTKTSTAKERLDAAGYDSSKIDKILLTHLHWDHAAVIPDFDGVPILTSQTEFEFARAEATSHFSIFEEHLTRDGTNWQPFELTDIAFGPFDKSLDLFGDQSFMIVPLEGHTTGSVGAFITTSTGKRFFFIGDSSWSLAGVKNANPKIPLVQSMVDNDKARTERTLALLHEIAKDNPDLNIVPTHDGPVVAQLAQFPAFE